MVKSQQLSPRLTTKFSQPQPVAMQNLFVMSFIHNFSQWNKLDIEYQRANPAEMKFPTIK